MRSTNQFSFDTPDDYTLNPAEWRCPCLINFVRNLPCPHIIKYLGEFRNLITASIVRRRWLAKRFRGRTGADAAIRHGVGSFSVASVVCSAPRSRTRSQSKVHEELLNVGNKNAEVVVYGGLELRSIGKYF